jgi:hypothetical protein
MKLRTQLGLVAAAVVALGVGCGRSPNAPSPSMANVSGVWVLQDPVGANPTTMVLDQSGSIVTGTWSVISESLTSEGTVSGTVSGAQLTIRAEVVTRNVGSNPCATVVTVVSGVLGVSEDALSGTMTSVRQPPCILRPSVSSSTWRRAAH